MAGVWREFLGAGPRVCPASNWTLYINTDFAFQGDKLWT